MLYNLAIIIYDIVVHLAAPFSRKPRKMMKGHWVVYELLRQQLEKDARYIWFHAASLGEFEQGRPLIEKIRAKYPDYRILLTFFSPSGYEVRKNYRGADIVCYLPFDLLSEDGQCKGSSHLVRDPAQYQPQVYSGLCLLHLLYPIYPRTV